MFKKRLPTLFLCLLTAIMFGCDQPKKLTEKEQLDAFISSFNNQLKATAPDSLVKYFDHRVSGGGVNQLFALLHGKAGSAESNIIPISAYPDNSRTKISVNGMTGVDFIVVLGAPGSDRRTSRFRVTVRKIGEREYKIANIDIRQLRNDYTAYQSLAQISDETTRPIVYKPITLAAFKAAATLKSRYDSVLWFNHVGGRTFFYVTRGKVDLRSLYLSDPIPRSFKIGLVSPEMKEIIPPLYDLVHNVNGTVNGMIEVEKGDKKGLYSSGGKLVVPVIYDEIYPLGTPENKALLLKGREYAYLTKDNSIEPAPGGFNIADLLSAIKMLGKTFGFPDKVTGDVMEENTGNNYAALLFPPSYLVNLQVLPRFIGLKNPLCAEESDEGTFYKVKTDRGKTISDGWFSAIFHSITNDYLGAREGVDEVKNVLLIDKKQNKVLGFAARSYYGGAESGGKLSGQCNENSLRVINDTLFEFKTTSALDQQWTPDDVDEGPYYHYLHIINGKLEALANSRRFEFTRQVKMDDSYANSCYLLGDVSERSARHVSHMTLAMLQYAKNEIFAAHFYRFKTGNWQQVFAEQFDRSSHPLKDNVNNELSEIEKYNAAWLDRKIKSMQSAKLAFK